MCYVNHDDDDSDCHCQVQGRNLGVRVGGCEAPCSTDGRGPETATPNLWAWLRGCSMLQNSRFKLDALKTAKVTLAGQYSGIFARPFLSFCPTKQLFQRLGGVSPPILPCSYALGNCTT